MSLYNMDLCDLTTPSCAMETASTPSLLHILPSDKAFPLPIIHTSNSAVASLAVMILFLFYFVREYVIAKHSSP